MKKLIVCVVCGRAKKETEEGWHWITEEERRKIKLGAYNVLKYICCKCKNKEKSTFKRIRNVTEAIQDFLNEKFKF